MNRQRRWQLKQRSENLCEICGDAVYLDSSLCERHLKSARERQRNKKGCNEWKPGGRGRPPKGAKKDIEVLD
jgi:hypothetical protein